MQAPARIQAQTLELELELEAEPERAQAPGRVQELVAALGT
jgi:hypothetical protein